MKFLSKNEINTGRQFEFDLAKAICIFGMVFVHCLEDFPLTGGGYGGTLYYLFVIVLDAVFGAGTFMTCLGVGLTYTNKNKPNDFIKRGITTFLLGYLLNLIRFVLPFSAYLVTGEETLTLVKYLISCFLLTDIMQFAGLAFLLFGLLKKIKVPDWGIATIAVVMSIIGSFVRFINVDNIFVSEFLGLFVGVINPNEIYEYYATFPLLNWFIFVVFGYFFGKAVRRLENTNKFYCVSGVVSGIIVAIYMAIAIPNKIGMLSGDLISYNQMTTWEALIIMLGAVFAFSLYHYVSKMFNDKFKKFVTGLSTNINKTYCIHWVFIGFGDLIFWSFFEEGLEMYIIIPMALAIYIISSLLAEVVKRKQDKKKKGL